MTHKILEASELQELTSPFQVGEFSPDNAIEIVASAVLSMVCEPGDRMAGALANRLGKPALVTLLIEGFEHNKVLRVLDQSGQLDYLKAEFGAVESILADSKERWLPRLSKAALKELLIKSKELGHTILTSESRHWPAGLADLGHAMPFMLFVEGQAAVLSRLDSAVSIVGSRAASSYGKQVSKALVRELSGSLRPTVSGGAVGIDQTVHQSSVRCGLPTVAVMAGGLDRKYPKSNLPLFEEIKHCGAVVTELPPGSAPTRWRFLQRNRLIAALTPTTVVVEAGFRSGSIRTANDALELDRVLFAVPGPVFSSSSAGTNELIRDSKAIALTNPHEFATGIASISPGKSESDFATRAHDAIRELRFPTAIEIARAAGLTRTELKLALSELTSSNQVLEHSGIRGELHYALRHGF